MTRLTIFFSGVLLLANPGRAVDAGVVLDPADPILGLPEFRVEARVATPAPMQTYPQPVSGLRFEPQVDVQSRNFAEAQGDVTVRGGIFENTGFRVGATTLYDPQTGHYFAEIPIDPEMLTPPAVLTGADNALRGFNSSVATLQYGLKRIDPGMGGSVYAGLGNHSLNRQSVFLRSGWTDGDGRGWGLDAGFARSQGAGTVENGDHDFERFSGRLQRVGERNQTDLLAGYQAKFFGWPNLYTPFGLQETESVQTRLFLANHWQGYGERSFVQVTGYFRRNTDDYEFNRFSRNAFFEHETDVTSFGWEGRHGFSGWDLHHAGQWIGDEIASTSLEQGPFTSRQIRVLTVAPEFSWTDGAGRIWRVRSGATLADGNRDTSEWSPHLHIAAGSGGAEGSTLTFELSESTQVPGYTAIGGSEGGLFASNPRLGRERSRNIEVAWARRWTHGSIRGVLFHREDDDLVDWTYANDQPNARRANAVDVETWGVEAFLNWSGEGWRTVVGYTWLDKAADYGPSQVDASFYALNYAAHRLTLAFDIELGAGLVLAVDHEFRIQEDNPLRGSTDKPVLANLQLNWTPGFLPGVGFEIGVDNLYETAFEEVPAVVPAGRQWVAGARYRW